MGARGEKTIIKTKSLDDNNAEESEITDTENRRVSLSFSVLRVTPITILLQVNVSSEAIVWCGAWPFGKFIDFHALQRNITGMAISSSSSLAFSHRIFSLPHHRSAAILKLRRDLPRAEQSWLHEGKPAGHSADGDDAGRRIRDQRASHHGQQGAHHAQIELRHASALLSVQSARDSRGHEDV